MPTTPAATPLALERHYQHTILDAAQQTGWRTAHFRPCQTKHGWRTAVEGDGAGFPDLVLIHARAGLVWFVEIKRDDNATLRPEQDAWRRELIAAGAVHKVLLVPSGLNSFVAELAAAHTRPRPPR